MISDGITDLSLICDLPYLIHANQTAVICTADWIVHIFTCNKDIWDWTPAYNNSTPSLFSVMLCFGTLSLINAMHEVQITITLALFILFILSFPFPKESVVLCQIQGITAMTVSLIATQLLLWHTHTCTRIHRDNLAIHTNKHWLQLRDILSNSKASYKTFPFI